MDFSEALRELKKGGWVARSGWNGKGMFLRLVTRWSMDGDLYSKNAYPVAPFIVMKTADNKYVP